MAKSLKQIFSSKNEKNFSFPLKTLIEGIGNLFRTEKINTFKLEGGTYVKEYTDKITGDFRKEYYIENKEGKKYNYQTLYASQNSEGKYEVYTVSFKENNVAIKTEFDLYKDLKTASKFESEINKKVYFKKDGISVDYREERTKEVKEDWNGKKYTIETIKTLDKDFNVLKKIEYKQEEKFMAKKELVSTYEYSYKPLETKSDKKEFITIETKYNKDRTIITNIELDSKKNEIKTVVTEKKPDGTILEKTYRHGNLLEEKTIDTKEQHTIIKKIEKGETIREEIILNNEKYRIERDSDNRISKIENDNEIKTRTYENGKIIETLVDKRLIGKMTILSTYPNSEKILEKSTNEQLNLPIENSTREVHVTSSDKFTVTEYGKNMFYETEKTYNVKTNELLKEVIITPNENRFYELKEITKTYEKGNLKTEKLTIEKNNGDIFTEFKEYDNGELVKDEKYENGELLSSKEKVDVPTIEKPEKEEVVEKENFSDFEDFSDI